MCSDSIKSVGVVIPVYNNTQFLDQCIESVTLQTVPPEEVIIVDDGSDDNCAAYLDDLKSKSKIIKVFHTRNNGQLGARLYGVEQSKSEWLLFLDSDDVLANNAIEVLKRCYERYNGEEVDCIVFKYTKFSQRAEFRDSNDLKEKKIHDRRELFKIVFQDEFYNSMCIKFVRKTLFKKDYSSFYSVRFAEDLIQSLDVYSNAREVLLTNYILYGYRTNSSSVTNSTYSRRYVIDNRPYELVYKMIKKYDVFNDDDWKDYDAHALLLFTEQIERLLISDTSFSDRKKQLNDTFSSSYYQDYISRIKAKVPLVEMVIRYCFDHRMFDLLSVIGIIKNSIHNKGKK